MEFTDYYGVLGVSKNADQAAIKAAYRSLARTLHPDVNKDPAAGERFKKVNEANAVLGDPEKRAKYDRLGADWEQLEQQQEFARRGGPAAGRPQTGGDFFETFFADGALDLDELLRGAGARGGSFRHRPAAARRGADLEETVDVTLEEAMAGGRRLLTLGERQVEVRIPAGVAEGSRIRVAGEGRPGLGGGPSGDIYLRVHLLPHLRYTVRGRDLVADLEVRDHQAVLGAAIRLAGPAGPLTVTVPSGTQAGRALRLRGKGIPGLGRAAHGDLLLTVRITVPPEPAPAERELYEQLAELRGEGAAAAAG
ncbi:MAG TPA: DnaJ C-terminal domain-containing protein [Candidatus Dormibacteraeota bacterium]|nr:DnaJ C-terminal domain-containing protein [Candidatus Dormibacteraeota bacterium]